MMTTVSRSKAPTLRKCCLCQEKTEWCYFHSDVQGYMCPTCGTEQEDYQTANMMFIGQPQKHLTPFSLEFEIAPGKYSLARDRALVLLKYGFRRTEDTTVDDEYKSPIYRSIRAFRKPLSVLDALRDLVTEKCGTHLHIECRQKDLLHAVHAEVFSPLLNHMEAHREETKLFWGRDFCEHATPINADRFCCFSLDSVHPTLQLRLPRFRSAAQYLAVIQFGRHTVRYLDTTLENIRQKCEEEDVWGLLTPGALGRHVLALYKRHVAQLPAPHPWRSRLPVVTSSAAPGMAPVVEIAWNEDEDENLLLDEY